MIDPTQIDIQLLQQQPEHFVQVARWHHQECERQGLESSLALRKQRLLLHMQPQAIPKTLVLLHAGQPLGCVSLVNYTYRTDPCLLIPARPPGFAQSSPLWLSNLFVLSPWRQKGLGNRLIEAAKSYAQALGVNELWLSAAEFTDYYQKRGWQVERKTRLGGRPVNVMRYQMALEMRALRRQPTIYPANCQG